MSAFGLICPKRVTRAGVSVGILRAMINDRDIYWYAKVLIERFGKDAPDESMRRAEQFEADWGVTGRAMWHQVCEATKLLLREAPQDGEHVH